MMKTALPALALALTCGTAFAQAPPADPGADDLMARFSQEAEWFTQTDGAALYRSTCQACHMEDGHGASGAGAHPPLAENPKMNSRHFLAGVILTGYHGMPGFAPVMSDAQIAAITNYVRTHFGNDFSDMITEDEVARLRPPQPDD